MRQLVVFAVAVAVCIFVCGAAGGEVLPSLRPVVPGYKATTFYGGGIPADGLAVRPDGSLLVVAEWHASAPQGVYVAYEGDTFDLSDAYTTPGAPFDHPDGVFLHPDGRVFTADPDISVLWMIPSSGMPPQVLVDSLPAPCYALVAPPGFDGPDVDQGDLLVCDWAYPSGGLYVVDKDTLGTVRLAGPPELEDGLVMASFGPDGKLYAVDTDHQERDGIRIVTISPAGAVTPVIDDYVVNPGEWQCGPLAVHPVTGKVYFADQITGNVYRAEPDGSAAELFAAGAAYISSTGMTFSDDGSALFVSDQDNGMVVKITGSDRPPSVNAPQIEHVQVDRGRDTDAPDWPSYHQRVIVWVSDPDGASDVVSVTITDTDGGHHTVHFCDYENWWEEDANTICCEFSEWHLDAPPNPGSYAVMVVDASGNMDGLTTPAVPVLPESCPEVVAPGMDSVIHDTAPTFDWNTGLTGSTYRIRLEEEGTTGDVWTADCGSATEADYNFDESAAHPALQPNHAYFWCIEEWHAEGSSPRVSLWTAQHARGRFAVYGEWPELPPDLPGSLAYTSYHWALDTGWEWGMSSVMQYGSDPARRKWLGPDWSQHPDWSPDGTEILFARATEGRRVNPDLWIKSLGTGAHIQVPGVGGIMCRWSPDGGQLCYAHHLGDGLWDVRVADIDGADERVVASTGSNSGWPSWSPDGEWIAYRRHPDYEGRRLWVVRSDGTDAHPVMTTGLGGYPAYAVTYMGEQAWSPDGTTLAVSFIAEPPGGHWISDARWGIGTIPVEGGTLDPVFVSPPGLICCGAARLPQWSPDGTKLVFSSGHHLPEPPGYMEFETGVELWMISADGSADPVRLTYNNSFDNSVSWTPFSITKPTETGLDVFVAIGNVTATYEEVVAEGSTSIVVTDELPGPAPNDLTFVEDFTYHLATTATISGTVTVAVDYGETAYPPVLGERLSLLLWDGAQWVDITTAIDTAGYTITGEFLPGAESDWYVALALDRPAVPEVKVMFDGCTEGRPSGPGLFVADGDFSNPVRVTLPTPGTALEPECVCSCGTVASALSPDGTRVVMERTSAGTLEVMDLSALIQAPEQESVPLTDEYGDPVTGHMPNWSPSGDRIAYVSTADLFEFNGIAVVNADGTGQHMIYAFPGPDLPPSARWVQWSPDGSRILFQMGEVGHGGCHLYLLENLDDPGGATLRQLTADDTYAEDQPHWSPDGRHVVFSRSVYGTTTFRGGDIWIIDVETGVERRITDSPEIGKVAQGWCPYDGYVYFTDDYPPVVKRIPPDGTGEEVVASGTAPVTVVVERLSWLPTGVWIDGMDALPGESITPKLGIADAENLAGVQAKVRYTGGSDTLTFESILKAESILDWAMPGPAIGADVASFMGYASDPETQAVSGAHFLFDLNVTNSPTAQPGDLQLLTFDDLKLSDDWGDPVERISFDGGVHTIPFAYLEVSSITSPVCADADDPLPFTVMLTALDWDGLPMADCDATVELGTFSWSRRPWAAMPVSPTTVALVDGSWSGEIALLEPYPWQQLFAHWGDFAGYSNWFQAIGKGDASADNRITIFDVVKIANMAIERGEWADWQWWAGDVNGDDVVDIFDVVQAASAAMDAMQSMGIGRAGAPPMVAPPSEPVIVTTDVSTSGGQVVVAVKLLECAGLAGVQVELDYDAKKLAYSAVSAGELLTGVSSWSVMGNDLGGAVKAIAYTPSAEVLSGGDGTILTFTFNQTGKGKAKVSLTSVELADVEGEEIPSQTSAGKSRGKGKAS